MLALVVHSLWLSAALGPVVTVESDVTCPAPEDVAARVEALLPARATEAPPDLLWLRDEGATVLVTLVGADGMPIGERSLSRDVPCADLAAAVAVVVAAWESDVHVEFRAAPLVPPPVAPKFEGRPPTEARAAALELGAGLTGSLAPSSAGAGPAAGALVVATWLPAGRWGVRFALGTAVERALTLGLGEVRWRRVTPGLGLTRRFSSARWALDLHVEGLAAWLAATGAGFATNRSGGAFDPGLGGGARVSWREGRVVVPWLALGAAAWLAGQTAYATPGAASVTLPRFELGLSLGLSVKSGP